MNTVFQRCVNYALKKVCFHNTPWCVNLHTPKTHLIVCYFKDKRCVWRTFAVEQKTDVNFVLQSVTTDFAEAK